MPPTSEGEPGAPPGPESRPGRNLPVAVATGLALAGLVFGTIFWHRFAFFVLVFAVLLVAQYELYGVLATRGWRPATPLGVATGAVLLVGAYWRGVEALSFGLVLGFVGAFLWYLVEERREGVTANIAATLLGVVYVPLFGAHVVLMRALPDGIAITIAFIGLTAFYDIGAYAAGSLFGRHKIAPAVSPSKTWEGSAGATLFVFASALAIGPFLGPFDLSSAAMLAAATAVLAPLGDLAESLMKRDLDVKDMGHLLPGHGGILDRIDALLFVAPAAYWLVRGAVL